MINWENDFIGKVVSENRLTHIPCFYDKNARRRNTYWMHGNEILEPSLEWSTVVKLRKGSRERIPVSRKLKTKYSMYLLIRLFICLLESGISPSFILFWISQRSNLLTASPMGSCWLKVQNRVMFMWVNLTFLLIIF